MLNETIDVDKPLDLSLFQTSVLPGTTLTGGEPPKTGGSTGTYFYDHEMLYPYAAMIGPEADDIYNEIWGFNTSTDEWSLIEVEGGRISYASNSDGVFAVDVKNGVSFYTGGWLMASENSTNGTIKFQSENSLNPQWSFMTAQEGLSGPHILQGVMSYVRKGDSGILVAFGGYDTEYKGSQFKSGWDWDQRDMSDIWVYDIFSNMWYRQQATGDIPPKRSEFCAVVSSAPDDSSFQITIYGGWDLAEDQAYDDIYVLSIPSFRWIRVNGSDPKTSPGRHRHKCDMWNDAQMIVSGGRVNLGVGNETTVLNDKCNSTYPPFKVLDTSTYTWRTQFEPKIEYSVPDVVATIIGGSSTGGATLNTPKNGWNYSDLASVFSKTVERDTYTYNPDASTTTEASSSNPLSGGKIAGIVVAVVVAVLFVAGAAVYFWIIRRRKKRQLEADAREARFREARLAEKPELDSKEKGRSELSPESAIFEAEMGKEKPAELDELKEKQEPVELPANSPTPELPG
ncbi:uncharacterized protein K452DRAFT_235964 [Aplosporella prunicola CBS 121167]|uniref:Kelch repeat protein n=1 Tax=Aplosporella prunicola CBS 121167 TaxID=1176127 RepID=A0A6A6B0F1_9PEZI|nr:uncharacterized protein K452DRAFT_235964 [Aplosporella prunicola CBS 121167]KAF2137356.1 hypothetical protein K452DRAFT_235964 [Aplosporella prunicola CBS 121167]